jgi:hypothetical protein
MIVKRKSGEFEVLNKNTGKSFGKSVSLEKAKAHIRLLLGVEHGMKTGLRPLSQTHKGTTR